jgi:hypothetical protein
MLPTGRQFQYRTFKAPNFCYFFHFKDKSKLCNYGQTGLQLKVKLEIAPE